MVMGRTKGLTFRGKGNVVLVAAQLDDADGNPTEEYVLLRADEFGRLRTVDGGGGVATFLGLTDTPASYLGQALLVPRVNAAEDALEFAAAAAGGANDRRLLAAEPGERWSIPGYYADDGNGASLTDDLMLWIPILVAQTRTYIRIATEVNGGGGVGTVARLGIYNATLGPTGLTPGTLVLDAGTVDVAAPGSKEIVISQSLTANTWYFLVIVSDGSPSINTFQNIDPITTPISGQVTTIAGDIDQGTMELTGQGIGALPDPSPIPNGLQNTLFGGMVRLRDV